MISATMHEAKTNLSELVERACAGEEVILTRGRSKVPVAKVVPIEPVIPQRLGFMETPGFVLTDAFWEPMTDEECGYGDNE